MGKGASAGTGATSAVDVPTTPEPSASPANGAAPRALKRSHNFCAGPAMIDSAAMLELETQLLSWRGSGRSLIEMSQREKDGPVQSVIAAATANIRELLRVPACYRVLLFQGGAHGQFAAVPMNLRGRGSKAQYVGEGFWSRRARDEAARFMEAERIASTLQDADGQQQRYPDVPQWGIDPEAAYVHIVSNETIEGLELGDPDVGDAVLVADMTSTLLSRPVDVSKYGVIYASGGKNLGPAGVCVVIVRDDLLDCAADEVPSVLSWRTMNAHDNLYNTQCTFAIWAMKTVTDGLLASGGLQANAERVGRRAQRFYAAVDSSGGFYCNNVHPDYRSRTSVPFRIRGGDEGLEARFVQEAALTGLHQLSGHHTCGGLRVCLYNGIPDEGLDALIAFMATFRAQHSAA